VIFEQHKTIVPAKAIFLKLILKRDKNHRSGYALRKPGFCFA
jgi:hypothetical protein